MRARSWLLPSYCGEMRKKMADAITEPNIAIPMFLSERRSRSKSSTPSASPIPMIGPMRGEMSMAPMITATLSVFSPSDATKMAKMSTSSCEPRKETPSRMSCSTSACGRRSALTLKYDNSRVIFSLNVGRLPCGAVVAAVCVDEIGEASCCRVSLSFRGWGEAM